ncbi:hypothetical protein JG687_00004299 [Phytophthora cactorum]|uniref:Uncharacterized protein n=1 Tax=Phytophthora cactorum TaxID=29920 RepID=A0A329SEZ8_9STRA|nr:hypothetical protein Pcac1_g1589 [Phytophthora cactorum]KAG2837478.1 hypothetical protein PC111_g4624 [Phytophthora cactorum]KAG2847357.1 hypothetical protein PC112_g1113 [Phytophthora cactorum]KAG2863024.1 hypothetical protein PC113_g5796 [Phytophthora cactorum]KAG2920206.1 hypothetical protein PC114_g6155 [Phytophthora cactorum]
MASSPKDHEVIDVGSGPALFEGRGRRALTLDGADELGREEEDEDQDDDNDDSQSTEGEEHAYRRGRQAIPMESPGDELRTDHLMLDDDDGDMAGHMAGIGVQRLRRLRGRRGFFHSDADGRSFRYRSSGGILQRITLRRRKREDHDVFWTAIGVLTVLSFALMSCITIYLTQTDFFESHQNDLFGTTVDNRFTVVAEDDAEIFLKSGYSNSVYSEGMIAFDDGELKIGRRALESEDLQTFYGVTFFSNGTSTFTNRLESPMIEADYLSARKGVIFDDGTVMTTAANSSGGVKEQGDLNLVSKAGAVVTSAGGKSLLFVDPAGTVTVANTKSDEPTSTGITLDGTRGLISISNGLTIKHAANSSSLSTSEPLYLDTKTVFVGTSTTGKVRISVPDTSSGGSDGDDGARALDSTSSAEESTSVTLEVVGQTSSTQKEGGGIRIVGGDGMNFGGDVTLVGGQATDSESEYGSININAGLDKSASSLTEIGSHGSTHEVNIHGLVSFNQNSGVNDTTEIKVGGGHFNVSAQRITLDNRATSLSELHVNSNDVRLGASSPSVQVGKAGLSTVKVQGATTTLDATENVKIGGSATSILVGNSETSGQVTKVASSAIELDASHSVAINTLNREAITTISGLVHFNGSSTTSSLLSITDTAVRANPPRFRVGAKGKTSIASIEANHVSIGEPGANATTLPSTGSKLELFSSSITVGSEASEVSMAGKSVVIDATETLAVGEQVDEVTLGSEDVSKINVQGEAVSVAGATTFSGASLAVHSSKIDIGGKTTSDIAIGASEANVDVGSQAKVVSIGVDSPTVNIGSDASTINLSGSVTINGKALSSRRLAGQSDVWSDTNSKRFGYLDADRFTIPVTQINTMTKFALRWDNGFSSEPHAYQVDTSKERMLSVPSVMGSDNELASRHLQISLHISSLMLVVQSEDLAAQPSKIRCRVYRHTAERSDAVAMEVNALVEHCFGTACEGGIFLGLQGQRIVPYNTGDSFSTQCALASTAPGELLLQGAQYSFAEQ